MKSRMPLLFPTGGHAVLFVGQDGNKKVQVVRRSTSTFMLTDDNGVVIQERFPLPEYYRRMLNDGPACATIPQPPRPQPAPPVEYLVAPQEPC